MRKNKLIITIACVGLIFVVAMAMNIEVSIRQGVNGRVREIRMPLYIKTMEFLTRHYEYQRIAKEITKGCNTDEEKVLAILAWTHENIKPVPQGMPVVDDHILNIIIRGYGDNEQSQDVFTNLCSYAGFPAFFERIYTKDHRGFYTLSFVKLNGKWRVCDSSNNEYFMTKDGAIASVDEIIADSSIIEKSDIADRLYGKIPYKEFYYNLKPITGIKTLRPEKQMLIKRLIFEIKKALGVEKEEDEADKTKRTF